MPEKCKESLEFLESAETIHQRMSEVNDVYAKHGLPCAPSSLKQDAITLVMGGEIILAKTKKGHKLEIRNFPYQTVVLNKHHDSLSWNVKSGNKPALENACRVLDILFMGEDRIDNYVYNLISTHKL